MKLNRILTHGAASFAIAAGAWAGDISGTVVFEGKGPSMRPISDMEGNPDCSVLHPDGEYPQMDWLVMTGENQAVQHVMVRVVAGLPEGANYPPPEQEAVLSQQGCIYTPHVFVLQKGQNLRVVNPDLILHNIHALPKVNEEFNKSTSKQRPNVNVVFDKVEGPFSIKCDTHPWMQAFGAVVDHPFHAVTDEQGAYTISGLPAGQYTLEFWHERLGTKTFEVEVAEEGVATLDVTYTRPK